MSSSNAAQDWVGQRVRVMRGRATGRIGTAVQYAEGKFRIVLPGQQTVVKHAADVQLLASVPPSDDAIVGRRVTITSGSYRGNIGVVRGRARGGFYLVALTDKMGDVMVIMKKAGDIRATSRSADRTMAAAATILMEIMDRRMREGAASSENVVEGQQHQHQQNSPKKDQGLIKDVTLGARIPFAARAK